MLSRPRRFLLVKAGSGVATLGLPDSPGAPRGSECDTLVAAYNDLAGVEARLQANSGQVVAVIVEPVAGNLGVVLPEPDFLPGLRRLTRQQGALLIFDDLMTGFRVAFGGAQTYYQVRPDLTTLGKVIGGGLPVGAYARRGEIMQLVATAGPVYQAVALSGKPLVMTEGIETLTCLPARTGRPRSSRLLSCQPPTMSRLSRLSWRLPRGHSVKWLELAGLLQR